MLAKNSQTDAKVFCTQKIGQSGIPFGTNGFRDLVEQFTDEVCEAHAVAFLSAMREQGEVVQVTPGMGRRQSSPGMAGVCSAPARAMGTEVVDMVFCRPEGEISKADEQAIGRITASYRLKEISTAISRVYLTQWERVPGRLQEDLGVAATVAGTDTTDGICATLANGDAVHLRPYGYAPKLRCYVESGMALCADQLLQASMRVLRHP